MVHIQGHKLRESGAWDAVKRPERQSFLQPNQTSLSKHDSSLCLTGKPDLPSTSGWKFVDWNRILCNLCQSNPFDKWHLRQRAYFFVLHKTVLSGRKWFPMSRVRKTTWLHWQVFFWGMSKCFVAKVWPNAICHWLIFLVTSCWLEKSTQVKAGRGPHWLDLNKW